MNKMETKAQPFVETHELLVDNYFLLTGNLDESNAQAHHVQHHIAMTWMGTGS